MNRRRILAGALALAGLAAGVLVAQLGWSDGAREPAPLEWLLQLIVLLAAIALVARVVTRRKT
jgi:hypothetical protein